MSGVSEEEQAYHQIMDSFLTNQKLPSLQQHEPQQLFPFAENIPESLNFNLESKHRVVKVIKSHGKLSVGLLRGFYYQLLKLCFQMEDEESSKDFLEIVKQIIFDQSFLQNEEVGKYLKFLGEFFVMMEDEECPHFQTVIDEHHQIDQAFISVLGLMVSSQSQISQSGNQIQSLLSQLCELFENNLLPSHPYYKFQESDTYIFIEGADKLFLIFDDLQEESELSEEKTSKKEMSEISKENSQLGGSHSLEEMSRDIYKQEERKVEEKVGARVGDSPERKSSRPNSNHSVTSGYFQQQQVSFQNIQATLSESHNNFKKGTDRISNPYELSTPSYLTATFQPPHPVQSSTSFQPSSPKNPHYYSPPNPLNEQRPNYEQMKESNYTSQLNTSKNDSTIINMFGDMLRSGKFDGSMADDHARNSKKLIEEEKILESQEEFQHQSSSELQPNFGKKNRPFHTIDALQHAKSVKSVNQLTSEANSGSILNSRQLEMSIPERYSMGSPMSQLYSQQNQRKQYSVLQNNHKNEIILPKQLQKEQSGNKSQEVVNFDDDEPMFYRPKNSNLRVISQVTASKQSINQRNSQKQQSKGSIYRQFSDTRILKLMRQPHKTKVDLMRNRYKGQHFNL